MLAPGGASSADEERARALTDSAAAVLDGGRVDEARTLAERVVAEHPATAASGRALALVARAASEQADWTRAQEAAARLERILPPDDARRGEMIVIQARALHGLDRTEEALTRLLTHPTGETSGPTLDLSRTLASELSREELARVLGATPPGQPLAAPAMAAYARSLLLAGDPTGAERYARAALEAGAEGADAEAAEAVLEGRVAGGATATARVGALLPMTGSPALRNFAEGISEGVEAAMAASGMEAFVEMETLDAGGEAESSAALVRAAEADGALALIGPLQDATLAAAAAARQSGIPLVSPTAFQLPAGAPGVYTLGGTDPGAARALAAWAASAGVRQTVVLHAAVGTSAEEARIFTESFETLGGSVLRALTFQPGSSSFRDQIEVVRGLRPDALVVPVPPEELIALAPQITFYGLDTLGVRILGTAGWTDPVVLDEVDTRHLDGVVAASPGAPGSENEGYQRFVEAYEEHFRRTLRDPRLPALGYDAASLVLLALRAGARTPESVARAIEDIEGFQGATGVLSVEDGRIVREHGMVCLWQSVPRPLAEGEAPEQVFRPWPPDPETGIVREGPGRPGGFRCPDVLAPLELGGGSGGGPGAPGGSP